MAQRLEQDITNSNSIKLVFSDLKEEYTFTRRRVNSKYGFATLPADVDSLQLMGMPLTTCPSTGFRFRVSYEVMNSWGRAKDGIGGYSGLYFLAKNSRGVNFFVKMVLNADDIEQQTMQNSAEDSYQGLMKDAMFYGRYIHNSGAEGVLVPLHYGLWDGRTEQGGRVVVSIREWAGLSWSMIANGHSHFRRYNTLENRHLVGRTIELLHEFGIIHGDLGGTNADHRHILLDIDPLSKEDRLLGKARCMVVDFSTAARHTCKRRVPLVDMDVKIYPQSDAGCDEIARVATTLGMSGMKKHIKSDSERQKTKVYRSMEWLHAYSDRYPDLNERDLRAAQRCIFYREPPIHPLVQVCLEDCSKDSGAKDHFRVNVKWPAFVVRDLVRIPLQISNGQNV